MTLGFNALFGLNIVGLSGERFIVALDGDVRHMYDLGQVHGGVYLALVDTVMASVARTLLDADEFVQTVDLRTIFLRPCAVGRIFASAGIIRYNTGSFLPNLSSKTALENCSRQQR